MGIGGTIRVASLLFGAALILVALPPQRASAAPPATFDWGECPVEVPAEHAERVQCGVLTVPETRAGTSDRTVRLPVARIASTSSTPPPDPLVFAYGGPGQSTLSTLGYWLYYGTWATDDRDLILLEQRGDLLSEPTLNCPEVDTANQVVDGRFADDEEAWLAAVAACHDRLTSAGVDLSAYSTAESAADLADLRALLGFEQWNIYGLSYGSRLALTVMRDRPQGLRAAILDGVYPPNVDQYRAQGMGFAGSLRALFDACGADPGCSTRYPDLEADLKRLFDRAGSTPPEVTVSSPVDGAPLPVTLTADTIAEGLFNALYDGDVTRALPFVINRLSAGHESVALPLAQNRVDWWDYGAEGLLWSVECAEEVPFHDATPQAPSDPLAALYPRSGMLDTCDTWTVPESAPVGNELVRSDIPALLLSGGRDPVTPPGHAELAAPGLPRSFSFTFPTMGHGAAWQTWMDPCPASIAAEFLREPTAQPDAGCIGAMAPTRFLTTDDIHPTPAVFLLNRDVLEDRRPLDVAVVVLCLAVLVGAVIHGVVTLIRRRRRAPAWAVPAALVAAVSHLSFVPGFGAVLTGTDPLILGFGVPPSALPLWALPAVAALATVALAVLLVRAWLRGTGAVGHRVALSVVAVASTVFLGWLLIRGLLLL